MKHHRLRDAFFGHIGFGVHFNQGLFKSSHTLCINRPKTTAYQANSFAVITVALLFCVLKCCRELTHFDNLVGHFFPVAIQSNGGLSQRRFYVHELEMRVKSTNSFFLAMEKKRNTERKKKHTDSL